MKILPRFLGCLSLVLLTAFSSQVLASADPDWKAEAPEGTSAEVLPDGHVKLWDGSPNGTPTAIWELQEAVSSGEIRWRSRSTTEGKLSFGVLFFGPNGRKAWDVAVYNKPPLGIHIRQEPQSTVMTTFETPPERFEPGKWTLYRLVFDTETGRAQLYLDDRKTPVAEVSGFETPVARLVLSAGYGTGVGFGAEFADVGIEPGKASFLPLGN